ncbi:MAG: membrane dipeptidase [Planctomycetota bacterium]
MKVSPNTIFDAHLDLAYLAELGRDMTSPVQTLQESIDPHPPAAVTLPELQAAGVHRCLGTIFTEALTKPATAPTPIAYPIGDARAAYDRGIAQINRYHAWARDGRIRFFNQPVPETDHATATAPPIELGILIENADPVLSPDDLPFWSERGVVAIGLSWVHQSRYAGGNGTDSGLTDLGRRMIDAMAALGLVLDFSHLSQRATEEALEIVQGPVCATHSNCRALLGGRSADGWQRHLDDERIAAIAQRGGVIGLNLYKGFVRAGLAPDERPTIDDTVAHIDHICQITGNVDHAGLGSDLDGGFNATRLPADIDRAADLPKLFDALRDRGYSDDDTRRIAWGNWSRLFGLDPAADAQ